LFVLFGVAGCASLEERLAKRVACDHTKLLVKNQVHAPAYTEYKFTCEGKEYVCRDVPFYSNCEEDKGKKKADENASEKPADTKAADAKPVDKKIADKKTADKKPAAKK
ncbi:MAG: hypothetical protein ACXVA9_10810, partial [Bdellovibrionales bacterium]